MKTVIPVIFAVLIFSGAAHSRTAKQVLEGLRANYEGKASFEIQAHYRLYKGLQGDDLKEAYTTEFKRNGRTTYSRLSGFEFVDTETFRITVDKNNRTLTLTDPVALDLFNMDYKQSLRRCSDVRLSEDDSGTIRLRLVIREKTDLPYSSILLEMDQNYSIQTIVFYYNQQIDFSPTYFEKELDYPRLEVHYDLLKDHWNDKIGITDPGYYIEQKDGLTKPAPAFSDYTIYDYRTLKN